MIFEVAKTYDHVYCMQKLGFSDVASFQKWVKRHEIAHFRCNGTWVFSGDSLVEFFRASAKTPEDWKKHRCEQRLEMEE